MMDRGEIAFSVGVELSYLNTEMQKLIKSEIDTSDHKPSYAQSNHMHKDFTVGKLTGRTIKEILNADKPNQKPVYKLSAEKFKKYIKPNTSQKEAEEYLLKACEHYERTLRKRMCRDER